MLQTVVFPAGSPILAKELCSSVWVVIRFSVTQLSKVLVAQLLSLVGWPAQGRVWVVPYSSHFLMMELTVLLGTFNTLEFFLYPSQDRCFLTIISWISTDSSLDFMVEFLLWHELSTVEPYIERCVSFLIMSNQLNWSQVDSNQVVETSQGWSKEMGCIWAQFGVSLQRGWILAGATHFSFSFLINL